MCNFNHKREQQSRSSWHERMMTSSENKENKLYWENEDGGTVCELCGEIKYTSECSCEIYDDERF